MTMALIMLFVMMVGANAAPQITEVNIDKTSGEDIVLVSFINTNTTSGIYTGLAFKIDELGTTKDFGVIKVDTNQVLQYKLSDITDSYNLLQKGNTYKVVVSSTVNTMAKSFLFGEFKSTQGLDVIIDKVEVNNEVILEADTIQVMNGETLKIDLKISALSNLENARFMAYVEGYEHSPILSSTEIFSLVAGKTYIKSMEIKLPTDMNSLQDYRLRISGANDLSGNTYKDFLIYVDTQRNRVDILDLVMTPSSGVEAGQNIVANVRMKNRGQKSQDSVKVSVEVPELGIKESSYTSNLNSDGTVTSDDMLLFIPEETEANTYEVKVSLTYNDGYTTTTKSYPINVVAAKVVVSENLLVNFKDNVNLVAGKTTTLPIVVANSNSDSKPISIGTLDNTWADVEVSPSLAMVKGGDSATFVVSITPKASISGQKELALNIKDGSNVISDVTLKTYVDPSSKIS